MPTRTARAGAGAAVSSRERRTGVELSPNGTPDARIVQRRPICGETTAVAREPLRERSPEQGVRRGRRASTCRRPSRWRRRPIPWPKTYDSHRRASRRLHRPFPRSSVACMLAARRVYELEGNHTLEQPRRAVDGSPRADPCDRRVSRVVPSERSLGDGSDLADAHGAPSHPS